MFETIFLGEFIKLHDIIREFGIGWNKLDGCHVLIAVYDQEEYSGSAFVLYEKDRKLFEVNGSHCSCHGLSEVYFGVDDDVTQWQPEEVTLEALKHRLEKGTVFNDIDKEMEKVINYLEGVNDD